MKGKLTNLETHSILCIFVRYLKETRGYYLYSTKEHKVLTFLEENYMKYYKPKSKLILKALTEDDVISPTIKDKIKEALRKEKSQEHQQSLRPRRSEIIVRHSNRYIATAKSYNLDDMMILLPSKRQ